MDDVTPVVDPTQEPAAGDATMPADLPVAPMDGEGLGEEVELGAEEDDDMDAE